ncbi:sporulation inhibitor of replication protein SirA [Bacillus pacificus]
MQKFLLYNEEKGCPDWEAKDGKRMELYLIQEDIAKAYFGREYLFFDLFARFLRIWVPFGEKVLYKQMMYITMPLQVMKNSSWEIH